MKKKLEIHKLYNLSPMQEGMLFHSIMDKESGAYFEQTSFNIKGSLDVRILEKSFSSLIERYDILRTNFIHEKTKRPQQVVFKEREFKISFEDISLLKEGDQKLYIDAFKARDKDRGFDLVKDLLVRISVFKINEESYKIIWSHHHIIMDGWCLGIIIKDLLQIYLGHKESTDSGIMKATPYFNFIKWLDEQNKDLAAEYWKNYLEGYESVAKIPRILDAELKEDKHEEYSFKLDTEFTKALEELAREKQITVNTIFQTVWGILLQRYNNVQDVVFGAVTSGRPSEIPDIENMVGLFINTIPVRINAKGKSFIHLAKNVQEDSLMSEKYSYCPLYEIQTKTALKHELIDNLVVFENYPIQKQISDSKNSMDLGFCIEDVEVFEQTNYDLYVAIGLGEQLFIKICYNSMFYPKQFVKKIEGHIKEIIMSIIKNPEIQVDDIEITTKNEKKEILHVFNNTKSEYPSDKSIIDLFRDEVHKNPQRVALVEYDMEITYEELDRSSSQLAFTLAKEGVKAGDIVAIMAERSISMLTGVIAILKAGGVYLPVDPDYPKDRINYMLKDSNSEVILVQERYSVFVDFGCRVITLEDQSAYKNGSLDLPFIASPYDAAYVIYTSGSTGRPKGVIVEHKNVVRLVKNTNYVKFEENDRILQTGAIVFDASTFEIWGALLNGLSLYLVDDDTIINERKLGLALEKYKITTLWLTSALFNQMAQHNPGMFINLKNLIVGGEVLSAHHINMVRDVCTNTRIINGYGPTENTTFSVCFTIDKRYESNIPIGKPISNSSAYIVDRHQRLVPVGIPGELLVGGDGVGRGYLNSPELTNSKFIPNPFAKGERAYKTGDMARWLPDGNIEFLGRIDQQVKIRGFRIELGEIESRLKKESTIKDAVVVARDEKSGTGKYICAYLVSETKININSIKEFLLNELPEYMIPSSFVQLDIIPVTANGKVDKRNLPEPDGLLMVGNDFEEPVGEMETKLALIWADVLGVDKVGRHTNFFDMGGHSLKATNLTTRINKEFNVDVPLRAIFQSPTLKDLSMLIEKSESYRYASIQAVEPMEYYPVSSAQKRMIMLEQFENIGTAYNVPYMFVLNGLIDKDKFENAIKILIGRHETLRTFFIFKEGVPIQKISDKIEFNLQYDEIDERDLEGIIENFIQPFDLEKAPLMRVALYKIGPNKHFFAFDMHHIISDGTSMANIINEFALIYEGKKLPNLRIQYKDFAIWQNKLFECGDIEQQKKYWLERFGDGIPVLNLPIDYARPSIQSYEGDRFAFELDLDLSKDIKELCRKQGVTLYMMLLSAYNILLSKYTGQEDIVVGSPIAGRPHADLAGIIGVFVNTLAMRNFPKSSQRFDEFLAEVMENALKAYENQDFQFEELIEKLELKRELNRNPLFDTMFVLQNMDSSKKEISELSIEPYSFNVNVSKFDITFSSVENAGRIGFSVEYCTKLFRRQTIETMAKHYINLLKNIVSSPMIRLCDIDILDEVEKSRILNEFNRTEADYPREKLIHQIFEEQVDKFPENIAVIDEKSSMTYKELNKKANKLARVIRISGAKRDCTVGIMAIRSADVVIGAIAVLKSGAAYLPIDPDYPQDRITYMIEDSNTQILLTQKELSGKISESFKGKVIYIDDFQALDDGDLNLDIINKPNDIAYVIYTSGTTGKPKGAMIEHRNVTRLLINDRIQFDFNSNDVWTMFHSFCFDFSVWEMYGALLYGGKLIVISKSLARDTRLYLELLKSQGVTVLNQTPTAFYNLVNEELRTMDNSLKLRYVIFGGEALKPLMLKEFKERYPQTKLINMYGITETTVHVTYKEISDKEIAENISNIGTPIPTLKVYIMDKDLKLVPVGVAGELCVGGDGVGRGYLNRKELTDEKFVPNPYAHDEILYRSGDLARFLQNGEMEYLGRIDHQVKIRGHRIEIGEIETQLLLHEFILETVVIARENKQGDKYLCAYIVADEDIPVSELRKFLSVSLPEYMIPLYFVRIEKIPLTSNGKVDRRALPEPESSVNTGTEYVTPKDEVQERLVSIWQDVLGINRIGIKDSFFDLGGDSIKAIQVSARLHKYGLELKMKDLFQYPTIEDLSSYVKTNKVEIFQGVIEGEIPLTPIQRWFFECKYEDMYHYNQSVMLYNENGFDEEIIVKVMGKVVEHHDALRIVFKFDDNKVRQINRAIDHKLFDIKVFDFKGNVDYERMIEQGADSIQSSINLETGPIVKLGLFKTDAGDHLLIAVHHLAIDGVSWRIIFEDISYAYSQAMKGDEIVLQDKTHSFMEYSRSLIEYAESKRSLKGLEYWSKLASEECIALPKDNIITSNKRKDIADVSMMLTPEETDNLLKNVNKAYNTEINDILITALGVTVKKWNGADKILIGMEGHGREDILDGIDINRTVGWFTSIYPVVLDMSVPDGYEGDRAMGYSIKIVKDNLNRLPDNGIGYGILRYLVREELKNGYKLDISPEICFNYLGQFDQELDNSEMKISHLSQGKPLSPEIERLYSLDISGMIAGGSLNVTFSYNKNEYNKETMKNLIDMYKSALVDIIKHCMGKEESEITPTDLTDDEITIEELESIEDIIGSL